MVAGSFTAAPSERASQLSKLNRGTYCPFKGLLNNVPSCLRRFLCNRYSYILIYKHNIFNSQFMNL